MRPAARGLALSVGAACAALDAMYASDLGVIFGLAQRLRAGKTGAMSGDERDVTEHLLSTEANRRRLFEAVAQASRSPTVYRSRTNPLDRKEAAAILREVLPLVDGGGESLKPSRKAVTALAQFIAAIRHDERLGMMVRMTSNGLEEDLNGGSEGTRAVDEFAAEVGMTVTEDGTAPADAAHRRRGAPDEVPVQVEAEHGPMDLAEVLEQTLPWVECLPVADRQRFVSEVEEWRSTAEASSDPGRAASLASEVSKFETDAAARARRVAGAVASGRLEGALPPPEFFRDAEDFVSGACSAEEFIERARGRWGLPAEPGLVELLAQSPAPAEQGCEAFAETGGPLTPEEEAWADGVLGRSPTREERRESIEADADFEFDPPRLGLTGRRVPDFSVDDVVADLESVPGINDDLEQRVAARDAMEEAHRARTERLALARSSLAAIDDVDVGRQVDRVRGVLAEGGLDVESQDLWLTTHLSLLDGATPVEAIGEGLLYEVERAARQRR